MNNFDFTFSIVGMITLIIVATAIMFVGGSFNMFVSASAFIFLGLFLKDFTNELEKSK